MKKSLVLLGLLPLLALGDSVTLKDGSTVQGVVRTIAGGKVTIELDGKNRVVDILQVTEIDFDTPHADEAPASLNVARSADSVTKAQRETRSALDQIKNRWSSRKSVNPGQTAQWAAEKERFATPLANYRKAIEEMYRNVAAHVDNYNKLGREANDVYVGVKGLFNLGSPLVPEEQRELPLKNFLPGTWYDELYYDAYSKGYKDAVEHQQLLNPRPSASSSN